MQWSILAFACGIAVLQLQTQLPDLPLLAVSGLFGIGGMLVAAGLNHCRIEAAGRLLSGLGALALGFAYAGVCAERRMVDQLPVDWELRDIVLTGLVAALPQRFERGERFEFEVETVQTPGARVPRRIVLSWYRAVDESETPDEGRAEAVHPGERWRLTVRLKRPHGNANPHGFDYEAWLLERGIRATGTIRARGENLRLDAFVWRPGVAVERLRERLRRVFLTTLPEAPYLGVLVALTIGDQRAIPAAQWNVFNRTGVTHLVSI